MTTDLVKHKWASKPYSCGIMFSLNPLAWPHMAVLQYFLQLVFLWIFKSINKAPCENRVMVSYWPLPRSRELTDLMLWVGCRGSRKDTWAWEPTAYTDQSCPYARHTFSLQWGSLVDNSWGKKTRNNYCPRKYMQTKRTVKQPTSLNHLKCLQTLFGFYTKPNTPRNSV